MEVQLWEFFDSQWWEIVQVLRKHGHRRCVVPLCAVFADYLDTRWASYFLSSLWRLWNLLLFLLHSIDVKILRYLQLLKYCQIGALLQQLARFEDWATFISFKLWWAWWLGDRRSCPWLGICRLQSWWDMRWAEIGRWLGYCCFDHG